jgi:asparagine synthase (glutamine-hydrolysing)
MCGIFGAVGPSAEPLARRALRCLSHRGPDGEGVFHDAAANVALAHTRLAILDLSQAAAQPMTDVNRQATLVFNGEIYNYKELRRELSGGYAFRSNGDAEVLLAAYLRWGEAMLSRLNGMFALAVYDHRDRSVLLARDMMGLKPLYFTQARDHFAFASEIKALLHVPGLSRTVDLEGAANYVAYLYGPGERTMLRGVSKLRPGHALRLTCGGEIRQWRFHEPLLPSPTLPFSRQGAVAEMRMRLETAVDRQMVSDVPVGAFLSGGLDSSAVCAYAAKGTGGLDCFTLRVTGVRAGTEEGFGSDLPYARRMAAAIGARLHVVDIGVDDVLDLDRLVWLLDEPQADPAALATHAICSAAREAGVKVLLSGAGGDDIMAGYRRHAAQKLERLWRWLPGPGRKSLESVSRRLPVRFAWARRLRKGLNRAGESPESRMVAYHQWIERDSLSALWSADVRRSGALPDPDLALRKTLDLAPAGSSDLDRMLLLDATHFLCDHNLNYIDKMSMSVGVEVRAPLLDPDLVSLVSRLPEDLKLRGLTGKWIFREAMRGVLPEEILRRPKTGMGAPIRRHLADGEGRLLRDYLGEDSVRRRGIFDPVAVRRLVEANSSGRIDASYVLFALAAVEAWCRRFIDSSLEQ